MAKRRRTSRKPKTGWVSKGKSAIVVASKALALAIALKGLINVERKFHLSNYNTTVANTGVISLLTGVAQGDTAQTRDGNKFKAHNLSLKLIATINASATNSILRVIIFKDKASNGAAPGTSDLLEGGAATASNGYLNHYNNVNCPYRFKVLADMRINLNQTKTTQVSLNKFFKLNHHITFGGATGNQTDAETGHIYMLMCHNESTNLPTFDWQARLGYIDN